MLQLPSRYLTALRRHLKRGSGESLGAARCLGCEAAGVGLVMLDLVPIHEWAVRRLARVEGGSEVDPQEACFYAEFLAGFVETNRKAAVDGAELKQVKRTLVTRTAALVAANEEMEICVDRGRRMEVQLRKSGERNQRLLEQTLERPEGLRELTHRILQAQERERRKMSCQLQNEIVQILVAVQVSLLTLKSAAKGDAVDVAREIDGTRRLVAESIRLINRIASEFNVHT